MVKLWAIIFSPRQDGAGSPFEGGVARYYDNQCIAMADPGRGG